MTRLRSRLSVLRRHKLLVTVIVVVGVLAYAWCTPFSSSQIAPASSDLSLRVGPDVWSSGRGDPGARRATVANPRLEGEAAWRHRFDAAVAAPIVVDDTALFVALQDGRLVALSVVAGRELWSVTVPGQLDQSPTIAGNALYMGTRGGRVIAINSRTGIELWTHSSGQSFASSPIIHEGVAWVGAEGRILALDAQTGDTLWAQSLSPHIVVGAPVISAETVVIATRRGQSRTGGWFSAPPGVVFFDRRSGAETFRAPLSDMRSIASTGDTIVALSERSVVAFEADSSQPWWSRLRNVWAQAHAWGLAPAVPPPPHRWAVRTSCDALEPVMEDTQVVIACADGVIRAYDLRSGEELWQHTGAAIVGAPVLTRRGLLVAESGALILIDTVSGIELERRTLREFELQDFVVTNHGLLLTSEEGHVVLMR